MKRIVHSILLIVFIINVIPGFAQDATGFKTPDSLKNKSFEELQGLVIRNVANFDMANLYAQSFLAKAKQEKDTTHIFSGYSFLSYIHIASTASLKYTDSIIQIAKLSNNKRYLCSGNMRKGDYYFEKAIYDKALDNYLIAKKYADGYPQLNILLDYNIGVIRSRLGDDEEALEVFKKSWKYVNENNFRETSNEEYLIVLFALADNYNRVKKYDSASYYNKLGVKESLLSDNQSEFYHFVLNEGVNHYYKENYKIAYDSINKVLKKADTILSKPNILVGQYYFGEILLRRNQKDSAIAFFRNVDSLTVETGAVIPDVREAYEHLITYYKNKGDSEHHLKYIERLLQVDSVLNTEYKYISKKITQEYDTPKLINEKEEVIARLQGKNKVFSSSIYIISLLLAVSIFGLVYYYNRQRKLKKRFEGLMQAKTEDKTQKPTHDPESIGISDDIVQSIVGHLEKFEESDGFLKPNITIGSLSKKFNTNSKYLSKVINTYKGKNFSLYINELRVDYVVEKLKVDKKFRNYTIKAVSAEIGFNTTEAFSKAFHKKTGIYPSYFIKKLEQQQA